MMDLSALLPTTTALLPWYSTFVPTSKPDLPDCVEPSRRPHDCAVCQFINWVDSALPGESYQLSEDWVPEAQALEEACNVAVKN